MSNILSISEENFVAVAGNLVEPTYLTEGSVSNPLQSVVKYFLTCDSVGYRERDAIEDDPSIKQLIPYVVFMRGTEVFRYYRTQKCGEERLRAKSSIGIGGHIEEFDGKPSVAAYCEAVRRECMEEIGYEFPDNVNPMESITGLLYDPIEDVGKVHVGIVHVIQLGSRGSLATQEDALSDGRFQTRSALKRDIDRFEVWSQLVIPTL